MIQWEDIEQVHYEILEYLSIPGLMYLNKNLINKDLYSIVKRLLIKFKKSSEIFNFLQNSMNDNENRIKKMNLIVFNMKFMKCVFRDFKKYLFYISDFNINISNEFLLLSKLMKCYYIKRVNENLLLMIYVDTTENIYYSFFEKKIIFISNIQSEPLIEEIPQSGYIKYKGELNEINKNVIMRLINN